VLTGVCFFALVMGCSILGFLVFHLYLLYIGRTTNETFKFSSFQAVHRDMLTAHRRFTDVTEAYKRHLEGNLQRRKGRPRVPTGCPSEPSSAVAVAAVVGAEAQREALEACSAAARAISAAADSAAATEAACAVMNGPCNKQDRDARKSALESAAATRQSVEEAAAIASAAVLAVSSNCDSGFAQPAGVVGVGADAVLAPDGSAVSVSSVSEVHDVLNDDAAVGCVPSLSAGSAGSPAKQRTAAKQTKSPSPSRAVSTHRAAGVSAVLIHPVRRLIEELHDIPEMLEHDPGAVLEPRNIYRIGLLASLRRAFAPPSWQALRQLEQDTKSM